MSDTLRMWLEVLFNLSYLIVIWSLVVLMFSRLPELSLIDRRSGLLFAWAFGLLAAGDSGHVGFRVLAYASGGLEQTWQFGGLSLGPVGIGAMATAFTVTGFYVLMLIIWQERSRQPYGWLGGILFAAAIVRFLVMLLPQNEWNNVVPPQPFSLIRNLPLMVMGVGAAFLFLRDARLDRTPALPYWIGGMIILSYSFYTPVILWVQQTPLLGMLMIPKTLAYLGIAVVAYRYIFMAKTQTVLSPGD